MRKPEKAQHLTEGGWVDSDYRPVKTLRDEYAMAALPALIAGTKQSDLPREARASMEDLGAHLAKMTFAIADAMLTARKEE